MTPFPAMKTSWQNSRSASGYDLIVPSDYMVAIMIQLGLLKALDAANIPNIAKLNPQFLDQPYDPGNKYSLPYLWGVAGIGYDAEKVTTPPTTLAALFDPAQAEQYAGKISLLNDSRETIGAALKYLGYSMNSTDPAQLEEAKQVLLAVKPYVLTFDSDTYSDCGEWRNGDVAWLEWWFCRCHFGKSRPQNRLCHSRRRLDPLCR